jgi:hypothetical protein
LDKQKVLGLIRLEIDNIRRRGFSAYFRDSILCINAHKLVKSDTCEDCALLMYVPEQRKQTEVPCFHIVLNAEGDTVGELARAGDRQGLEAEIIAWLERTADELEGEILAERGKRP